MKSRSCAVRQEPEARIAPDSEPTERRASRIALYVLLLGVAVIGWLWMPAQFLEGDPQAWREEARMLLLRGELNVPAGAAQSFGEPGQWFVRNEANGLYYSKYGIGNVLFTLPPLWLQKVIGVGNTEVIGALPSLLVFNLWNLALSVVLAGLLYRLSAGYTRRVAVRVGFVLATMYGTFLWFYQRAQSSELYQTILFVALFSALVSFLRSLAERRVGGLDSRDWRNLALVWLCAGLLVLIRVVYGLFLPVVVLLALYVLWRSRSRFEGRSDLRRLAAWLLIPPLLIVGALAVINQVKFGAPWLTGYHQWRAELHWPGGRWSDGLWGLTVSPRFGALLYFPVLVLALFGWRRFAALHRADAVVILAMFLPYFLFVSSLPSWAGERTYGPRYLLFILPVLSLPAIVFAEVLAERWHTWRARGWALVAAACLAYSGYLQMQVNRLPFSAYYYVRTIGISPELVAYFYDHHVGVIAADLLRHRTNVEALPYFDALRRVAPPEYMAEYRLNLARVLSRPNLYWALPPEERR